MEQAEHVLGDRIQPDTIPEMLLHKWDHPLDHLLPAVIRRGVHSSAVHKWNHPFDHLMSAVIRLQEVIGRITYCLRPFGDVCTRHVLRGAAHMPPYSAALNHGFSLTLRDTLLITS